jgi:signal transduction histidine kinase
MRIRSGLRWGSALLFPLAFFASLVSGLATPILAVLALVSLLMPFPLLRHRPLAGLLACVVGFVTVLLALGDRPALPTDAVQVVALIVLDLAVALVAARSSRQVSVAGAVIALAAEVAFAAFIPISLFPDSSTLLILAVVTAWVIGNSVRQRRLHNEAQRTRFAVEAVQAERLRIAREVHDIIAHSIGVIAIQAGMGRRVIDTQPAEARNALGVIEDASRDTLATLRRLLGGLRRDDLAVVPGDGPGLADLDRLVARSRDAGVVVELRQQGAPEPLPPDIELTAYRVIQEAITNVTRHSGVQHCDVVVEHRPGEVVVEITDEGRGGEIAPGYGIAGMRERVGLLHGLLEAGPRAEGGFRVAARIPIPSGLQ